MSIADEDLTIVNETIWKVKFQSKGKNINILLNIYIDYFWAHLINTIVIIIIITIIVVIFIVIIIVINPSIVLVNNILQSSMYIKTFSHQNFTQS